ncbi:helix-turn-helix transcriptional regulator [Butyrivibrio sp. AD3002]|uniref:helix-turn-helix transcriptional regulator n=1 Tax=Butyrivibrio sp. AD3002 TaxID=1280670 RepID=UPI0003B4E183|nr:helix-turn-helix domain-containing protein [Butyrivibrio sp. AD3002]
MKHYETVKEACKRTGLSRQTLKKFYMDGVVFKIGRSIRFDSDALDKAIEEKSISINNLERKAEHE